MSLAARYRTAAVTVKDWTDSLSEYNEYKAIFGSIGSLCDSFAANTWPSTPIVEWMQEAAHEFHSEYGPFIDEASEITKNDKSIKIQAAVSRVLLPRVHPICFYSEFTRRLKLRCEPVSTDSNLESRVQKHASCP